MTVINKEINDRLFNFIFGSEENREWTLSLYEHQSSYNPNMPVRLLQYISNLYSKYMKEHGLSQYKEGEACRPLQEYSQFVKTVIDYKKTMGSLESAVDKAITDMPKGYILKPFLESHKVEVKGMLLTEYNEAEEMEVLKMNYREDGRVEERQSTINTIMRKMNMTLEQAMEFLEIPLADSYKYKT